MVGAEGSRSHNKDIELPEEIIEYLDGSIPLSDVDIVIPALVTYETKLIDKFDTVCDGFRGAFKKHFEEKFGILDGKEIIVPPNIKVFFILLPLKDLNSIKERLEQFEGVFRNESL